MRTGRLFPMMFETLSRRRSKRPASSSLREWWRGRRQNEEAEALIFYPEAPHPIWGVEARSGLIWINAAARLPPKLAHAI